MSLRALLLKLTTYLEAPRVIYDREGGTPYLSRWYLTGPTPIEDNLLAGQIVTPPKPSKFQLYLHRFHRSDDDGALHNHPWVWAVSFVLVSGYSEERRVGDKVVRRTVKPFRFNFIRGTTFHRVDLVSEDAWSLFLVGPKASTWYFWDRDRKARSQWRDFINAKRGYSSDARWQPDSVEPAPFPREVTDYFRPHEPRA
jgi:hypothetical protein